jgi:hypothetical protein
LTGQELWSSRAGYRSAPFHTLQAQNGRQRAKEQALRTLASALIQPASIAAAITREAMAACSMMDSARAMV